METNGQYDPLACAEKAHEEIDVHIEENWPNHEILFTRVQKSSKTYYHIILGYNWDPELVVVYVLNEICTLHQSSPSSVFSAMNASSARFCMALLWLLQFQRAASLYKGTNGSKH